MKKCSKCNELKSDSEFNKNITTKDGLQAWCRDCCKTTSYYQIWFKVLLRDTFTCQYCGRTPQDGAKLRVDHIIHKSKNGDYTVTNLITSCEICNLGKSDILLNAHDLEKVKKLCNTSKILR